VAAASARCVILQHERLKRLRDELLTESRNSVAPFSGHSPTNLTPQQPSPQLNVTPVSSSSPSGGSSSEPSPQQPNNQNSTASSSAHFKLKPSYLKDVAEMTRCFDAWFKAEQYNKGQSSVHIPTVIENVRKSMEEPKIK